MNAGEAPAKPRTTAAVLQADRPSSPSEELAARRRWTGPTLGCGALTAELADFCASGVSVVIASCDRGGGPVVGRGLAARIDGSGVVRLLLRQPSNTALLQAVEDGAGLAVTFTKPSTHRSIQLKAARARLAVAAAADAPEAAAQTAAFRANLVENGLRRACGGILRVRAAWIAAVEFAPEHAFVQTPGPGAGSALRP